MTGMAENTPSTLRVGAFPSSGGTPNPPPTGTLDTHPVEVVGRIREHPDGRGEPSVLQPLPNGRDLRIASKEHQQGYKVFSLDGVSKAENENLESFYHKYAEARVDDVKLGGKCTIMMYGPTGAGKSHTMFGYGSERGVAYHALIQIMGEGLLGGPGRAQEVKASVWEIYNEDIFDLLAQTSNPAGSIKGHPHRVKLDVKGKKVRNSTYINDYDANRLLKEIQKVETKRVTKRTNCNDRSSRSHCVVTFEVPAVDGRLVLIDMAGSENIEVAGVGLESKMQTGRINQGNGALKRVVEAIANGESYIPYRDSKLTMILQESFEDKNAKVLMILCASPDPKDLYKTLGTFEYGAKAKRIVRLPNSPAREKASEEEIQKLAVVNAKGAAKDACIMKMRREKANYETERELKEKEVADLRRRVAELEERLGQMEGEVEVQRSRAERAQTELSQLKMTSFSRLEANSDAADWGSAKQQHNGVMAMAITEGSPGSRAEKIKSLGPLAVKNNKSNVLANNVNNCSGSSASPREKKEKKFSSSMLSFFKGGDSSHSSKKSSGNGKDMKARQSPQQQVHSPKSEKKRQAGQEPPSPKTAEKKQHTGQQKAVSPITWRPSTLQQLLKVKEEDEQGREKPGKQEHQQQPSPSSTPKDTHHIWPSNLLDHSPMVSTRDLIMPDDATQVSPEDMTETSPEDQRVSMTLSDDGVQDEAFRQAEKDPLGLGICSESKLHRKGWLPIIIEEKEEELERLARKSMEDAAAAAAGRISASCPRFRDSSPKNPPVSSGDLSHQMLFPSNLLRDKFSPGPTSIGSRSPSGMPKVPEFHGVTPEQEARTENDGFHTDVTYSPMGSFLQRLSPALSKAEPMRTDDGVSSSPVRDNPALPFDADSVSARKARIENIFLLCGHRREIAARTESPTPTKLPPDPLVRDTSSFRYRENQSYPSLELDANIGTAQSPFRAPTGENRLLTPVSPDPLASPLVTLPSPQKSDSPARHRKFRTGTLFSLEDLGTNLPGTTEITSSSIPTPTASATASPAPLERSLSSSAGPPEERGVARELPPTDYLGQCDVQVKWESKDSTGGKLVCVVNVAKSASLADLRRAILPHVPVSKEKFTFLFLEEGRKGGPLEPELEPLMRVSSLPDSPTNKGSRVVCLRLPGTTGPVYTASARPFRPIENTIPENGPTSGKAPGMKTSPKVGSHGPGNPARTHVAAGNLSTIVRGIRTVPNCMIDRGGEREVSLPWDT